jgi:hypothetical protein
MTARYVVHETDCPDAAPDRVRWVCDLGHWFAWELPAGMSDRCPVVIHDAESDGRCYGTLRRPDCVCEVAR